MFRIDLNASNHSWLLVLPNNPPTLVAGLTHGLRPVDHAAISGYIPWRLRLRLSRLCSRQTTLVYQCTSTAYEPGLGGGVWI
jgi:hypothetical protein